MATPVDPRSTTHTALKGTVVLIQGDAYLRDSSGRITRLHQGDSVQEGDSVITQAGATVEVQMPSGARVSVGPDRAILLNEEFFATAPVEPTEAVVSSVPPNQAPPTISGICKV